MVQSSKAEFKIRVRAYKLVEYILRNDEAIKNAIVEARLEQSSGGNTGGGGSGHAMVSDPTAISAIKQTSRIKSVVLSDGNIVHQPEKWLMVLNYLYSVFPKSERRAVRYFYDGHSAVETSMRFETSERNFYYIREDFRQACVELACQCGLVKVGTLDV